MSFTDSERIVFMALGAMEIMRFFYVNFQILFQTADISQPFFEERVLDRKNGIDRRVQYAYDAAGNVLKQAILGTDGECLESSTRYDLKDRATHRTNPAGGCLLYTSPSPRDA